MTKLFIKTHGCQMNEYDSAKMLDVLRESESVELTQSPEDADILLLGDQPAAGPGKLGRKRESPETGLDPPLNGTGLPQQGEDRNDRQRRGERREQIALSH